MTEAGRRFYMTLNEKEKVVIVGVAQGDQNKKIAERLGTTEQVVKNMLRRIFNRCGQDDRQQLMIYLFRNHVVECPCGQNKAQALAEVMVNAGRIAIK